ncbi:dynein axonemal heavy chain 12 [Lepeophtheirus salmonis]|uniref:dynein axonemal heavy chain 12 n=1 Tax=Lepeophtheirus salmonis TaxID=72036 RepID=UPI003AF37D3A
MNINIDPYCRLFTTVLKWQKAEKKCTDGAFLDLDASQIENSINEFMDEMSKLQKLFKLKFKQQALDGDSKYAKMNLEDSNPMNLPPPLRISALTIIQIKSFQKNIQLITCLCNPGLRKRHWIRMGSIIGFDITPNSGSSLRKMLCLNLEQYMPELEKISNMATREHGLELTLANMKTEWESNNLELMSNDRGHKILSNFESIQELIDDHTSKTETVKGSPYFRPFKNEVESWENDLKTVHDSLSSLEIVQKNYVNLESFFSKDEIISQMPLESQLFKNVKSNWIFVLEHIYSTPQVMKALNKTEVINALNDSTSLLEQIQEGLDLFTDQKCVTFPRLFFLSRNEVLSLLRNTVNPIEGITNIVNIIFDGISCLLIEENQIIGFKGLQNELITIKQPINIHASGNCVERILMELENQMILTLKQQILDSMKATDPLNLVSMAKYSYQANEVSLRVHWTEDVIDGIKGGINALKELKSKLYEDRDILLKELKNGESLATNLTSSLILQNIYFVDSISDLLTNEVLIEEDFVWEKKPKTTLYSDDVFIDIFNQRHKYCYEYSGTFSEIVVTPEFEIALLTLFICYDDHKFTIIRGGVGSGKTGLFTLACSILGKQHQIRKISKEIDTLKMLLPGICSSGAWLLIKDLESASYSTFRDIVSITKKIEKALCSQNTSNDFNLFGNNLPLLNTTHIAFTSDIHWSCNYIDVLRPITLIKPRVKEILENKILAYNYEENDGVKISEQVMSLKHYFSSLEKYELSINYKDIGLLLRTVSHLATTQPGLLPWQRFQTAEYIIWKGRMDLSDTEPIIEKTFKNESSLTKLFAKVFEENEFAKYEARLGLKGDESQLETVKQVLFSLKVSKKVILCGSPVSGKSSVLKVAEMYENERLQGNLEVIRLRPNCYNCQELFGTRQCNEWKDGTLTSSLKKEGKENKWIVFEGPMRSSWISKLESIIEKGDKNRMILESRDHLIFKNTVSFLFETTSISEVSPKFISTCTLIIATSRKLNWILLLDQWIEHKDATQSWKVGYEDSIRDIVIWLCPAILKFIEQHTKPVIPFIPIHSVRCFLSCFTILLTEALPNLKEKKYLRMWIQAAIVVSIVWTMGSTLTIPDRSKFDVYLRDILSGKKQEYPLPPSLNNKFDAIPPSEGTIYDFIFDFKARGQWKHWTDIIKNLSPEDSITYYENKPIVHSVDSLRFSYFYNINMKKNIPTLLVGHSGCGKTSIVGATLMNSQDDLSFYKYNCITTSTAQNFRSWMMKKLEKKTTNTFGPLKSKGVLLIDNVEMPENEKESLFRDFISQMIENNSWYNLPLENSFNLENMYYVLCMTIGLKDSPETDYDKELYSRTWSLFNPEPHEDILARIFSSSMNATFRRIGFPPEISSVIPAIINSTLNVYNACRKALIIENEMCFLHIDTVNLRDIVNVLQCFSLLPKENADNKKLFTRLWVHEILRVFYDRLLCDDAKKMIYDSIRECVKNNFRENFESGFEHLGKINGLVTQQNLRNLMFGVYLSDNKKDPHYMEMTDVEQFEKKLLGKIKDFNASEDSQNDPVHLFPLRTTLEMISRICRQLNIPQGHMLIYGEGVEGRRITIRSAAILLGIKYIEVENYKSYDDLTWRLTIRDIIKRVGSMNEEIVLCLHFRQLERHDFLARDLDDFLTNGFIHDLFTTDEIHQINENVHKLMMENENNGGKSNSPPIDITPAILEKEFISNCEKKLHIMFIIDNDDTSVFEFLRSHRSIVGRSIVYRKEEWPEDTLKKAGDFVFEELSLSRKIKKALNQFCVFAYTEARKLSNKVKEKNIRISPSVYLRLLRHVVHIHSEKSGELEQRKSRLQIGIEKFNQVEEQLKEFELELESIREKIQNVKKEKEEMKSTKFNLDELLESVKTRYEEVSSQLDEYIQQKGEKEHIYKDKLARIEDKYSGKKKYFHIGNNCM